MVEAVMVMVMVVETAEVTAVEAMAVGATEAVKVVGAPTAVGATVVVVRAAEATAWWGRRRWGRRWWR